MAKLRKAPLSAGRKMRANVIKKKMAIAFIKNKTGQEAKGRAKHDVKTLVRGAKVVRNAAKRRGEKGSIFVK